MNVAAEGHRFHHQRFFDMTNLAKRLYLFFSSQLLGVYQMALVRAAIDPQKQHIMVGVREDPNVVGMVSKEVLCPVLGLAHTRIAERVLLHAVY